MAQYADFDAWLAGMHERGIAMGLALTEDDTEQRMLNHIDGLLTRMLRARKDKAIPVPYTATTVAAHGSPCPACGTPVAEVDGATVDVRPDGFLGQTHRCPKART